MTPGCSSELSFKAFVITCAVAGIVCVSVGYCGDQKPKPRTIKCIEDDFRNVVCDIDGSITVTVERGDVSHDPPCVRDLVYSLGRLELVSILDDMGYWSYEDQSLCELREQLIKMIYETGDTWRLELPALM